MNEEKKVRERDEQFLKFKNSQEEKIKWIQKAKDQEIVQMVGTEDLMMTAFAASLEECNRAFIFTQLQALKYIASKMKVKKFFSGVKKSPIEEKKR